MRCTHADYNLSFDGTGFSCSLHGSHFDEQGEVTKGPAEKKLTRFKTEATEEFVILYLR